MRKVAALFWESSSAPEGRMQERLSTLFRLAGRRPSANWAKGDARKAFLFSGFVREKLEDDASGHDSA